MLFDNNNVDLDFNLLNLANLTNEKNMMYSSNNRINLYSAKEGFLRGNMFRNEYKPYKNLTFINISPKNDREAKLFTVMCYAFAITDLNLYLDVHPEDREALNVLKEMIEEEKQAKKEFIIKYGPIDVCDTYGDKFSYIDSPWPWDGMGGNIYV